MLWIKGFHVLFGTSFLGLFIANLFYFGHSRRQARLSIIRYALTWSLVIDLCLLPAVIFQFVSAYLLMRHGGYSLQTAWICVAYLAFSLVSLAWLLMLVIKWHNYRLLQYGFYHGFQAWRFYCGLNIGVIIIFMIIIHDAVMKTTWFTGFHC